MSRCFTLVELMVSLSIIAILASLIQPMLHGAIVKSRETECKSHLRQLGIQSFIYANNNNDRLPHEDAGSSRPPYNQAWYQVVDISWHERGIPLEKGFNIKMNDRLEEYGSPPSPAFRKLSTIKYPTKTPYLFDSKFSLYTPKGVYGSASDHHEGTANFLMLDLHVENIFTSPKFWQKSQPLYWNPDVPLHQQVL